MNTNSAEPIAIQIHQARKRLTDSEARAERLSELIKNIGDDGSLASALRDAIAIIEDLISQQRHSIGVLEARERVGASMSLAGFAEMDCTSTADPAKGGFAEVPSHSLNPT